nr:putative ribonuclease H-like domain-containing protein [Tanacetum cinerariifolium]
MFAVSACSRHQVTPMTSHLNAVKKIFKYLKGQPNLDENVADLLTKAFDGPRFHYLASNAAGSTSVPTGGTGSC